MKVVSPLTKFKTDLHIVDLKAFKEAIKTGGNSTHAEMLNHYLMLHVIKVANVDSKLMTKYHALFIDDATTNAAYMTKHFQLPAAYTTIIEEFLYRIYTGMHANVLCADFMDHWSAFDINILNKQLAPEIFAAFTNTTMPQLPNFSDLFQNGFNSAKLARIFDPIRYFGRLPLHLRVGNFEECVDMEVTYVDTLELSDKKKFKLMDLLQNENMSKYVKKLTKYGFEPQNFTVIDDNVVAVVKKNQTRVGRPVTPVTDFIKEPSKNEKWADILSYDPPMNNEWMKESELEKHFIENNVHYQAPITFANQMAKYGFLRAHNIITEEEILTRMNKVVKLLVGPELAHTVYVESSAEGSLQLGVNGRSRLDSLRIQEKLMNARILN